MQNFKHVGIAKIRPAPIPLKPELGGFCASGILASSPFGAYVTAHINFITVKLIDLICPCQQNSTMRQCWRRSMPVFNACFNRNLFK